MSNAVAQSTEHPVDNVAQSSWLRRGAWIWQIIAVAVGVGSVAWIWRIMLDRIGPGAATLVTQIPLTLCAAVLAWRFALGHERRWIRPAHQLARLIQEIRDGQTPIDSLSEVVGPMQPIARIVQELLHDVRREKQAKARINLEMDQQVRDRTKVLERKISSWQTRAFRDPLTNLSNRRQLDEQLPKIIEQCHKEDKPLSALAVDVDHFKQVNDTHGHDVGDQLLRDVAQLIRSTLREGDFAFRVGGDEFLIVLPGYDWPAGQHLARRLVSVVDQLAATVKSEPKPGLSIGIACVSDLRKITATEVLRQADAAMYQNKAQRKAKR